MGRIPCATAQSATSAASQPSETDVKAAFLYHFCSYVEWPAADEGSSAGKPPLDIAVMGSPEVARELRRILPGRSVGGRSVRVREVSAAGEIGAAHVLFVGKHTPVPLPKLLNTTRNQPTLIVTELRNALDGGAMINFVLVDGRVRFELAPDNARRNGVVLSSRLNQVAVRVRRGE